MSSWLLNIPTGTDPKYYLLDHMYERDLLPRNILAHYYDEHLDPIVVMPIRELEIPITVTEGLQELNISDLQSLAQNSLIQTAQTFRVPRHKRPRNIEKIVLAKFPAGALDKCLYRALSLSTLAQTLRFSILTEPTRSRVRAEGIYY